MEPQCLIAILSGLLPGVEPRYAYLALVGGGCASPGEALLAALAETLVLAVALAYSVEKLWSLLQWLASRLSSLQRLVEHVERKRAKAEKLVEKYGALGLAVFVAAPLPVTGVYTGAAVALLLKLPRKQALTALAAGGATSTLIVALLHRAATP